MGYTKNELIQQLIKCYEENGHTRTTLLNSPNNDYPSQVTYNNHFGSMADAREAAGLYGGHTREKVIESIEKCFDKHSRITTTLLNEDDELLNSSVLYAHFDTISDAIESADINQDVDRVRSKYTEEELLDELIRCKEEEGNTKTQTVDSRDGPSSQAYRSKFGSIQSARELAGINCKFNKTYSDKVKKWMENTQYEDNADAHIYVLSISIDGEKAYYIGESQNVTSRIHSHLENPQFTTKNNTKYGEVISTRRETGRVNDIKIEGIEYVIPIYRNDGESDEIFRKRRKYREHHEHLSVAIDKNTLEVYGGR
jgi:hypothetical protein